MEDQDCARPAQGAPEAAVAAHLEAAACALAGGDRSRARRAFGDVTAAGREDVGSGGLLLLDAEELNWQGRFAEAEARSAAAMRVMPYASALWYRAAAEQVVASGRRGNRVALEALANELCELSFSGVSEPVHAVVIARLASRLFDTARCRLAARLCGSIEACAAELIARDPSVAGWIAEIRAARGYASGDFAVFLAQTRAAIDAFERSGDVRNACVHRIDAAYGHAIVGRWGEVERELRLALGGAEELGWARVSAVATVYLGRARLELGCPEEAVALERSVLAVLVGQDDARMQGHARTFLARALARSRQWSRAEDEARAAVELASEAAPLRVEALATLAEILQARERPADAYAAARSAVDVLERESCIEQGAARARLALVRTLLALDEHAAARRAALAAQRALLSRADDISDPVVRREFLENVSENAETLQWTTGDDHPGERD